MHDKNKDRFDKHRNAAVGGALNAKATWFPITVPSFEDGSPAAHFGRQLSPVVK